MKTFDKQRIYRVVVVFQGGEHRPRLVIDNLTESEAREWHTMLTSDYVSLDGIPVSGVEWGITP
jgi:hypothetical protein